MCNLWTGEHIFIWTGNSSTDARIPDRLVCRCGAFYFNGKPANVTSNESFVNIRKELKIGYLGNINPIGSDPDVP
jgi:hypothetical protein